MVVASADGSLRRDVPIFDLAAFEFEPAGDTLAFIASSERGAGASLPIGPLRAIDPATGNVRTLVEGSVVTFFWSPDGRTIAAIRLPGSDDTKTASAGGASAGGASAILARAGTTGARTAAGTALRLSFVDPATGAVRSEQPVRLSDLFISQVLPFFDQYALSHRFWEPDSQSITLPVDIGQGVSKIVTFRADGSEPLELVDGQFASWSP
jgi:TolB protein